MLGFERQGERLVLALPGLLLAVFHVRYTKLCVFEAVVFFPQNQDFHIPEDAHQMWTKNGSDLSIEGGLAELAELWVRSETVCKCGEFFELGYRSLM